MKDLFVSSVHAIPIPIKKLVLLDALGDLQPLHTARDMVSQYAIRVSVRVLIVTVASLIARFC